MQLESLNKILEVGRLETLSDIAFRGKVFSGEFPVYAIPVVGSPRGEVELFSILQRGQDKTLMPLCPYDDVIRTSSYERNGYAVVLDPAMGIDDRRGEQSSWFGPENSKQNPFIEHLKSAKNPVANALSERKIGALSKIEITDDKEEMLFRAYLDCKNSRLGRHSEKGDYIFFAEESEEELSRQEVMVRAITSGLMLYTNFSPASISIASAHQMLVRAIDLIDENRVSLDKKQVEGEIEENNKKLKKIREYNKEVQEYKIKHKKIWLDNLSGSPK